LLCSVEDGCARGWKGAIVCRAARVVGKSPCHVGDVGVAGPNCNGELVSLPKLVVESARAEELLLREMKRAYNCYLYSA